MLLRVLIAATLGATLLPAFYPLPPAPTPATRPRKLVRPTRFRPKLPASPHPNAAAWAAATAVPKTPRR